METGKDVHNSVFKPTSIAANLIYYSQRSNTGANLEFGY